MTEKRVVEIYCERELRFACMEEGGMVWVVVVVVVGVAGVLIAIFCMTRKCTEKKVEVIELRETAVVEVPVIGNLEK